MTERARLEPKDILRWRTAGALALSPDGKRLAFVEMWCDADKNENRTAIYLIPTDGSEPARRITNSENGESNPKWSPDGRYLAFSSAREKAWRPDLYVLDMVEGGDARKVVELPRGVQDFAWSPDGTRFALTGKPPFPPDAVKPDADVDELRKRYQERVVFISRMHFRADGVPLKDDEEAALWIAPASGGEARVLVESEFPLHTPGWTPDGRVCFLSMRDEDREITWNAQLFAVDPSGGQPEKLSTAPGAVSGYAFLEFGGLACVAYPEPGLPVGCRDDLLYVGSLAVTSELDRPAEKHVLADTIDPVEGAGTNPTTDRNDVYFVVSDQGAVHLYRLRDGKTSRVIGGSRVIGKFAIGPESIVFMSTAPDEPASIRVCDKDGGNERVLHDPNPWFKDIEIARWQELWVEAGGTRAQAWVMVPPGESDAAPAAILTMHGGPHAAYGLSFNLLLQMLAAEGYAVILGNPPGSMSYGGEFTRLTHRAWGEADFQSLMAFCDEAISRGLADPDRLGLTGGSYGGFLTNWVLGHSDRFKAAVSARGLSNLTSLHGSSEFGWALLPGCFGANPVDDPEVFQRLSPLTYVHNINTPVRLIGCTDDYRVPMEQVTQLYTMLKLLGKECDLVVFRDSHHLIYSGSPSNKVTHMEAILDWFKLHLPAGAGAPRERAVQLLSG